METLRECYCQAARLRESVGRTGFWKRRRVVAFEPLRVPVVDLLNLVGDLTFLYFEYFTSRFTDRTIARQWVESAAVICVDLYRTWKSFGLTGRQ